jgi:hypothetical protein
MLEAEIFYLREKCVIASCTVVQEVLSDVAGPRPLVRRRRAAARIPAVLGIRPGWQSAASNSSSGISANFCHWDD